MKIQKEVKIGLYLVIIVAVLYWGINFLSGRNIFSSDRQFYAIFENVQGLQQTSKVLIRGLKVGMIEKIVFDDENNNFVVTLRVNSRYNIPLGTRAVIYSTDLLGSKAIKLELGNSNEMHKDGDMLASGIEGDLTNVLAGLDPIKDKVSTALDQLNVTLSSLNNILNEEAADNLSKVIANFNSITANLNSISVTIDELLKEEKSSIASLVDNVEGFTANLKSNNENINTIIGNLVEVSDGLAKANLAELAGSINDVVSKLKDGEGSLGKIMTDDSLYTNLVNTANSLNALLDDLRENPGRYVQFSVFGRKK